MHVSVLKIDWAVDFISLPLCPAGHTLPETNIAPENRISQRKLIFQPSFFRFFRGYVSFREGIPLFWILFHHMWRSRHMVAEMFLSWLGMDYWVSILSKHVGPVSEGTMQQPLRKTLDSHHWNGEIDSVRKHYGTWNKLPRVGEMVDYRCWLDYNF